MIERREAVCDSSPAVLSGCHPWRPALRPSRPAKEHRSQILICRASSGTQEAFISSLRSLSVHRLEPGHYIAPLLCSNALPFAVGLELFIDDIQQESTVSHWDPPEVEEADGLLCLQYILDGQGQVLQQGVVDAIRAGDSLLSINALGLKLTTSSSQISASASPDQQPVALLNKSGALATSAAAPGVDRREQGSQEEPSSSYTADVEAASRQGGESTSGCDEGSSLEDVQWDLVALKVLLADDRPGSDQGAAALARAVAEWRAAPAAGRLSERVVAGIIRRAREAAAAAFPSSRTRAIGSDVGTATDAASAGAVEIGSRQSQPLTIQQGTPWEDALPEPLRAALRNMPADFLRYILPGLIGRSAAKSDAASSPAVQGSDDAENAITAGRGTGAVQKKGLQQLAAYRLPNQTNRLALVFDPLADGVPFTFGLEIFEPGHKTPPHTHPSSQELFFILAGDGEGFCDGRRFTVAAGDAVAFPARSLHGINVSPAGRMYCLELMQPNDMFAEFVKAGQPLGGLADDDLCVLAALGCGGPPPAGWEEGSA